MALFFLDVAPNIHYAFHVPVGYGWSSPPTRRGCNITAIAATLDTLMAALGYKHYVAQGGDWGAIACRALAV
jgi:pimeloyl-ACP methyl ester carboxylesterase